MKTRIKHIDKCSRLFEVEIPPDVVNRTLEEVYKEIKKRAKIPGFRIGQAPQDLLEKYHSKDAEEEVLRRLIPEGYKKALNEHRVNPLTLPEIADVEFDKKGKLLFKAKLEIRPEIKLKDYKGMKVTRKNISVNPDEISNALKRLQEMHAGFEPVVDNRAVKKGDYTICDIEAFIDENPISKKHQNMWVVADRESSMLGLGENLINLKAGESKEIEARLPHTYQDKKYAGKIAKFKISVKEVKEKKLPNIDDEFAKDLGKADLESLKDDLEKQLFAKKQAQGKIDMENQILDRFLKDYRFEVPQSLVKRQFDILLKQTEEELLSRGLDKDTVSEKKKELEPKLKNDALNKIRIYFILDEISRIEDISVTEEDINKRLESIGKLTNQDIDAVRDYYTKNKLMGGLEEQLKEEKTLEWLLSTANVVEGE